MATTQFSLPQREVLTGLDNVVIQKFIAGISGGRTLDCSAFPGTTVPAGTVVITDGAGAYKPLSAHQAVQAAEATYAKTSDTSVVASKTYYTESGGTYTAVASPEAASLGDYYEVATPAVEAAEEGYDALPEGWKYAGVVACSVLASMPSASIMTAGVVNEAAAPYKFNPIKAALKAAIPTLEFAVEEYA